MNSATARTVREACGLAHRDIADALSINVRTVQRWESVASEEDIPPYAEQYYLECLGWLTTTVATVVDSVLDEAEKSGDPRVVNLSRYVNEASATRAGAHPHGCGEHTVHWLYGVGERGSSPRVWGTLHIEKRRITPYRLIPTGVGNTDVLRHFRSSYRAHPHGCGEHTN